MTPSKLLRKRMPHAAKPTIKVANFALMMSDEASDFMALLSGLPTILRFCILCILGNVLAG